MDNQNTTQFRPPYNLNGDLHLHVHHHNHNLPHELNSPKQTKTKINPITSLFSCLFLILAFTMPPAALGLGVLLLIGYILIQIVKVQKGKPTKSLPLN